MSAFDDLIAASNPMFLSACGTSVQCTPSGGSVKTITAIRNVDVNKHIDVNGQLEYESCILHVAVSDLPTPKDDSMAAVRDRFSFTGDSRTWYLRKVLSTDSGMHQLMLATSTVAFIN